MPAFWEGFEKPEQVKGQYLKASGLVGETLLVAEVAEQPDHTYNNKPSPRFLLRVVRPDGEEGLVSFGMGYDNRDTTIKAIGKYLAEGGDPPPIKIAEIGRFLDINPA